MKTIQIMMTSALSVLFMQSVFAQDWVWTGAVDNNFSTAGNWLVNDVVPPEGPTGTHNYVFNSAGQTINVNANIFFNSFTFEATAGEFTFDGGRFLAVTNQNSTGFTRTITQNSSSTQTFNTSIDRMNTAGSNFVLNANAGNIVLNTVQPSNQGVGYSVNGDHRVVVNNINTNTGTRDTRRITSNGIMEIIGSNTRSDSFNVDANILVNNTSGNAVGNSILTFRNNASLGGMGTASGTGTLIFQSGSTISPGENFTDIGTLSTGNLTLEDGFIYNWDFSASDSDSFNVLGTLDISAANGNSVINLVGDMTDFDPLSNNVLFTFGSIVGASDGQVLNWQINHNDADSGYFAVVSGNDVLVAIPEPGTLALIFLGGLLVYFRRRRS